MQNDEGQKLVLECVCSGEMLVVREDLTKADNGAILQREYAMAFYTQGIYHTKPSFWWRLKYAWNHLKTGKIYEDYIILKEADAKKLEEFLRNTNVVKEDNDQKIEELLK